MTNNYKIVHDRDLCIGCGACSSVAPEYWVMEDDGKTSIQECIKTGNGEEEVRELDKDFDLNNDAAQSCPVNCIHLFKKNDDGTEEKVI